MESILRWLRSCPCCHRSFGPVDAFCSDCFEEIMSRMSREILYVGGHHFGVLSLIEWTEKNPEVGTFIKALKGHRNRKAFHLLAHEFLKRLPKIPDKAVLVVPPSKRKAVDHAHIFAAEISRLTGLPFVSPFAIEAAKEQKRLKRAERLKAKFRVKYPFQAEAFILIDDLITTGGTARAAWVALGKPKAFTVWTVACRPLQKLL